MGRDEGFMVYGIGYTGISEMSLLLRITGHNY